MMLRKEYDEQDEQQLQPNTKIIPFSFLPLYRLKSSFPKSLFIKPVKHKVNHDVEKYMFIITLDSTGTTGTNKEIRLWLVC